MCHFSLPKDPPFPPRSCIRGICARSCAVAVVVLNGFHDDAPAEPALVTRPGSEGVEIYFQKSDSSFSWHECAVLPRAVKSCDRRWDSRGADHAVRGLRGIAGAAVGATEFGVLPCFHSHCLMPDVEQRRRRAKDWRARSRGRSPHSLGRVIDCNDYQRCDVAYWQKPAVLVCLHAFPKPGLKRPQAGHRRTAVDPPRT